MDILRPKSTFLIFIVPLNDEYWILKKERKLSQQKKGKMFLDKKWEKKNRFS